MTQKVREPWKAFVDSPATTGNWKRFDLPWNRVETAAAEWRRIVGGHRKLWLCWSVNDAWCVLQQKLVREAGWTPVVGWDPMCGIGRPPLVDGAISIDFSGSLGVPSLFMHVPLEFAFMWIEEKLAFWHSDLLLPRRKMRSLNKCFSALKDGEMAAVFSYGGLRNLLNFRRYRYWELCGCTTRSASQDQFDHGSGWWIHLPWHPNAPKDDAKQRRLKSIHVEHGVGIRYWEKRFGGKVIKISERKIAEGHFSVTTVPNYKRAYTKSEEIEINFDLAEIARRFGIADLLESTE